MADRLIKTETLQDIADAIREKRETTDGIDPANYAAEIRSIVATEEVETYDDAVTVDESATPTFQEDYEEGVADGKVEGIEEGIEQGKQAERDAFWDSYQDKGNRKHYGLAFGGYGWSAKNLIPKYNMTPTSATYMFAYFNDATLDVKKQFEDLGVILDTSKCNNFAYFCYYTSPVAFGTLNTVSASNLQYMFAYATVERIEKLILRDDGSQTLWQMFAQCNELREIEIEGVIGQQFSVQWATKLSHDSIVSIVNALSTTTSGITVMLSKTAVNNAFETEPGKKDGIASAEWLGLLADHNNWTISTV